MGVGLRRQANRGGRPALPVFTLTAVPSFVWIAAVRRRREFRWRQNTDTAPNAATTSPAAPAIDVPSAERRLPAQWAEQKAVFQPEKAR